MDELTEEINQVTLQIDFSDEISARTGDELSVLGLLGGLSLSGASTVGDLRSVNLDALSIQGTEFEYLARVDDDAATTITLDSNLDFKDGSKEEVPTNWSGQQLAIHLFLVLRQSWKMSDSVILEKIQAEINKPERWRAMEEQFALHLKNSLPFLLPKDFLGELEPSPCVVIDACVTPPNKGKNKPQRKFKDKVGVKCGRCREKKKGHVCKKKFKLVPVPSLLARPRPISQPCPATAPGGNNLKSGRGSYRCGRCFALKKGHTCEFLEEEEVEEEGA